MPKILNLVAEVRDYKHPEVYVHSFEVRVDVQDPEFALRAAVREYVYSGSEESKNVLEDVNGDFNWGDAMLHIPDRHFYKHGLTRLRQDAVDIHVNHDELLCPVMPYEIEEDEP